MAVMLVASSLRQKALGLTAISRYSIRGRKRPSDTPRRTEGSFASVAPAWYLAAQCSREPTRLQVISIHDPPTRPWRRTRDSLIRCSKECGLARRFACQQKAGPSLRASCAPGI
jgi:hypothetical protein